MMKNYPFYCIHVTGIRFFEPAYKDELDLLIKSCKFRWVGTEMIMPDEGLDLREGNTLFKAYNIVKAINNFAAVDSINILRVTDLDDVKTII